jgi:3-deoxy-D-manno-octulosonic-acid transferase
MTLVFDFIYFLIVLAYIPYLTIKGKWHAGFWTRLGFLSRELIARCDGKKNIWFHAVSVGELLAILGLIEQLRKGWPDVRIIVSTVTTTGYQLAKTKLPSPDVVLYAPLDFSFIVKKFLRYIRPIIYITAETEIWPNLFLALNQGGIPIVQVNGRISPRAFNRYRKVRFLLQPILRDITVSCMQTEEDARRLILLGANPDRVKVMGNMKFDDFPSGTSSKADPWRFLDQGVVWISGSTHPGEEVIVIDIYRELKKDFPNLRLVIAPRHIERTVEIAQLVKERGLSPLSLSSISSSSMGEFLSHQVLIIDTIGQLRELYRKASFVFIGKSLTGQGGQNVIEPAFYGKTMIVGPNMQNFRSIMDLFLNANAIIQIQNARELHDEVRELLTNPQKLEKIGSAAISVVRKNQGATERTKAIISKILTNR